MKKRHTVCRLLAGIAITSFIIYSFAFAADKAKVVFLTSTYYQGDLGGVTGADRICNERAQAAGLVGYFKAWLSYGYFSPSKDFTKSSAPYTNADGVIIAESWNNLVELPLLSLIDFDEFGSRIDHTEVWTNTLSEGTINRRYDHETCSGFTSIYPRYSGMAGETGVIDKWTNALDKKCDENARLYCFQQ